MALSSYSFSAGALLAGKPCSIVQAYTGNSIAFENVAIYSDIAGNYPIANPNFLDVNGNFAFYAASGTYGMLVAPKN